MDSEIRDQINDLKDFILEICRNKKNFYQDHIALETDLEWASSRFWARVIYAAEPLKIYLTANVFEDFKSNYEIQNSTTVNDQELFKRYWLRSVLGYIEIASGIGSLCLRYKEIRSYKNELNFLMCLQESNKKKKQKLFDVSYIDDQILKYQEKTSVTLDKSGIYFNKWSKVKDGIVEFSDFETYFKQYVNHWDDFGFISALYEYKSNESERGLFITTQNLTNICASFQPLFPTFPSINSLIEQRILTNTSEGYLVDFNNSEVKYWETLKDKISSYLWENIFIDKHGESDVEKVKKFLTKTGCLQWSDPLKYCSQAASKLFLDTAIELVKNEKDLEGIKDEFAKTCLDGRMSHDSLPAMNAVINSREYHLNNSNIYDILESFNRWEDRAHITYLNSQPSRHFITYLVDIIVHHDDEFYRDNSTVLTPNQHYARVKALLRKGANKPFLVWKVTRSIIQSRQEIIPYLITEQDLATVAIQLLNELTIYGEHSDDLKITLWKKVTQLFVDELPRENIKGVGEKVFEFYRQLNRFKYGIPFNRGNRKAEVQTINSHNKKELSALEIIEDCTLYPKIRKWMDNSFFFPIIFTELSAVISNFKPEPLFRNGTVNFPILQWDATSWVLKASTNLKFKEQFKDMNEGISLLTETFLRGYLENIEANEVILYDHFEEKEKSGIPIWSEKIERLQFVDWAYLIYFINKLGRLNEFIAPRIHIERTADQYHKKNNFVADKIRTHIGVLLQILKQFFNPKIPFGFGASEKKDITNKIEKQINEYLRLHIVNEPEHGKVDLFNFDRELRFKNTEEEALLPQIARALNWFSDKDGIIDSISSSGDINKLLILLNFSSSEGVRQKLTVKIKTLDIVSFLEKYDWIPEVQHSIINLIKFPELIDEIDAAILIWKEKVLEKKNTTEYKMILYQAELAAAYFKKDVKLLNEIAIPKNNLVSSSELSPYHYKEFYLGLLSIDQHPDSSYQIFDRLFKQFPAYASFALNRMVAKINLGDQSETTSNYYEALEEWKNAAHTFDSLFIGELEPTLSANILDILKKTGQYEELENRYRLLDFQNRMDPAILSIVISSLIDQKKTAEAVRLLSSARAFHEFSGIVEIQFIKDLQAKISGVDDIEELKSYYLHIYSSTPEKLVKIFPPKLNGKKDLVPFLVKEIILAAGKMLNKIKSIAEIKNEDKYNDIVEMALDARINTWGWFVDAQSRGAFSGGSGPQPGERDLPIVDSNKEMLLLCEAWIYREESNAKSHLLKIFNYDHKREYFAVLVYDTGERGDSFEENWINYSTKIVPSIIFPEGYALKGNLTDVSEKFNSTKSAIKVGTSVHGDDTIIYHIFVDVNYKINMPI